MSDADYVEDLPQAERVARVSKLVLQAPPGEINEVVNDAKLILNDQAAFDQVLREALPRYHCEQNTVVELPGHSHKTVLASAAQLPTSSDDKPARYFDPRSGQSFKLDLVNLTASELEPLELSAETTSFLASFTKPLDAYVANHFTAGAGAIFPHLKLGTLPPAPAAHEAAPSSPSAVASGVVSGEGDESAAPEKEAEATNKPPAEAEAEADEPMTEELKTDGEASADEPVAASSEADDKAVETALVETAEEIAAVAKEVEAELTLAQKDDSAPALTSDGAAAATEAEPSTKAIAEPSVEPETATETSNSKDALAEAEPAAEGANDSQPMEGVKEETAASEDAAVVATPVQAEAPVAPAAPTAAPIEADQGRYTLVLSGHRYSPTNFWSGSWRSSYAIDLASDIVQGRIEAVVHYYEQGNVQLHTVDTPSFPLPSAGEKQAQAIFVEVSRLERDAQEGINERLEQLGDKSFRALRRALPVTRQKVEWEKISGYKLGSAIGGKARPEEEAAL